MNRTITTICFLLISLSCLFAQNKQSEDQFSKDIRYLFTINGSEANYKKSITTMFTQYRKVDSDVPDEYWDKAESEYLNTSIDDIIEMIIPIYKKYLSHEDIQAYIKFYESPAGKHVAEQTSNIFKESMEVGMIWGKSIDEKINKDIEKKGYKLRLPFSL